jgi:allophanate hydrolase
MQHDSLKKQFAFGVPMQSQLQFFGNAEMQRLYRSAVDHAIAIGGRKIEIDYAPFLESAELLYGGAFVAERVAAIGPFYRKQPEALLPVLSTILDGAAKYSAEDAFNTLYHLQALRQKTERTWDEIDVMLLPTAGTIYTIEQVQADPLALNRNLGYYTNFVNLLDLSALAAPAGFMRDGLPGGVTFIAPAGCDRQLLELGRRFGGAS